MSNRKFVCKNFGVQADIVTITSVEPIGYEGDVEIGGDLDVEGTLTVDENVLVGGGLTTVGNLSTASITGTGEQINGNSVITGTQAVTGTRSGGALTATTVTASGAISGALITGTGEQVNGNSVITGTQAVTGTRSGGAMTGSTLTTSGTITSTTGPNFLRDTTLSGTTNAGSCFITQLNNSGASTLTGDTLLTKGTLGVAFGLFISRSGNIVTKVNVCPTNIVGSGATAVLYIRYYRINDMIHFTFRMASGSAVTVTGNGASMDFAANFDADYRPRDWTGGDTTKIGAFVEINGTPVICLITINTDGTFSITRPGGTFAIGETFFMYETSGAWQTNKTTA